MMHSHVCCGGGAVVGTDWMNPAMWMARVVMSNMRLSVALCTFNGSKFLQAQLDSLLAQERLPDEVVVGDDASTDETWDRLQVFARSAEARGVKVRLTRRATNLGYVKNFSQTLSQADGDVVFLCDQDDLWHPRKLALMEPAFAADPDLLLLCTDARLVDEHGQSLGKALFDALNLTATDLRAVHAGRAFDAVLLCRTMVTGATMAVRRRLIDLALPVEPGWIHDEWLAVVAAVSGRMDAMEQSLIDYRQHGGNQIGVPLHERTLHDKWRDLRRPRSEMLWKEAERLRAMGERLRRFDGRRAAASLALVSARRAHYMHRYEVGQLPHWKRGVPIWREMHDGNYRRFATGIRSALRDLLRRD